MIDPWLLENLVCPIDKSPLTQVGQELVSSSGRRYPVVQDVPVMLLDDREQTIGIAHASMKLAREIVAGANDEYCIGSLGLSAEEQAEVQAAVSEIDARPDAVDPVVSRLVAATNGIAYLGLVNRLTDYPIPEIPLPNGNQNVLLDIGCNWGRWCLASAAKGYLPIGIDPSLGAVLAAKRLASRLGRNCRFVVADGRFLPFRDNCIDRVWSFSVIQHFARTDADLAIGEMARVAKPGGNVDVQMPTRYGVRCLWHQARRGFQEGEAFDVRYYSIGELRRLFGKHLQKVHEEVHCYLGIGLLKCDYPYMGSVGKAAITLSECGRHLSKFMPPLKYAADSVYVHGVKKR